VILLLIIRKSGMPGLNAPPGMCPMMQDTWSAPGDHVRSRDGGVPLAGSFEKDEIALGQG
jgi:hypothetical protein